MDRLNSLHHSNTTGYDVFPGIRLFYHNIHAKESSLGICQTAGKNFLEIIHCREGRMEFHIQNEFCSITLTEFGIVMLMTNIGLHLIHLTLRSSCSPGAMRLKGYTSQR